MPSTVNDLDDASGQTQTRLDGVDHEAAQDQRNAGVRRRGSWPQIARSLRD